MGILVVRRDGREALGIDRRLVLGVCFTGSSSGQYGGVGCNWYLVVLELELEPPVDSAGGTNCKATAVYAWYQWSFHLPERSHL
jgi:hypothetical protein